MKSTSVDVVSELASTPEDKARVKRALDAFYISVEQIARPNAGYVQAEHGDEIRRSASKLPFQSAFAAAVAISAMPVSWPIKYRASIAAHLAPMMAEVVAA